MKKLMSAEEPPISTTAPNNSSTTAVTTNSLAPELVNSSTSNPVNTRLHSAGMSNENNIDGDQNASGELPDEGFSELHSPLSLLNLSDRQRMDLGMSLLCSLPIPLISEAIRRLGNRLQTDFVPLLPYELSLYIFGFLDVISLSRCMSVSRTWNRIVSEESLWRDQVRRLHINSFKKQKFLSALEEQERAERLGDALAIKKVYSQQRGNQRLSWRYLLIQSHNLHKAWQEGNFVKKTLSGHTDGVYAIQFNDRYIISGSRDQTVKIWDSVSLNCVNTIKAHARSVLCLQFDDDQIVTGSSDASIRVWNLHTGQLIQTLEGHLDSVLSLKMDDQYIVSGSRDREVKVWLRESGRAVKTLLGHSSAVNGVAFQNGLIVSGSGDRIIKVWDLQTARTLRNLVGHQRGVACIQFDGNNVVSGSSDMTIRLWDVHTGNCLRIMQGHTELIRALWFDNQYIVSGSYDETCKIWDTQSGRLVADLKHGHQLQVFGVRFDASRVISCGQDGQIIIWNFGSEVDTRFF